MDRYQNRQDAGKILAEHLKEYKNRPNTIVLALPRGGVPVAFEISQALSLPLDIFIVRKLGVPGHEELAMGAIATGGVTVFNTQIVNKFSLAKHTVDRVIQAETEELQRRETVYRGTRPFPDLNNKTVILVDDGIATGATIRAAIQSVRKFKPALVIVAVPVAGIHECSLIANLVDKMVCPMKVVNLEAVGIWYEHFDQTTDEEVHQLLARFHSANFTKEE